MKKDSSHRLRIKDIARLAGVSTGTVDRVIHNRGQVSEENIEKIKKLIKEHHYTPNLLAKSLAHKRSYRFVTLFPEFKKEKEYWSGPVRGIEKASLEFSDFNIHVEHLFFDQFSKDSYMLNFNKLIELHPDAALISPVFKEETIRAVSYLNDQRIPYIFIDSNIDALNNLSYFGQHSYQSGFTAAKLLQLGLPEKSSIAVIKPSGDQLSNQVLSREQGFNDFFLQAGLLSNYNFIHFNYYAGNPAQTAAEFSSIHKIYPDLKAAIVFNSRVYEIAKIIEQKNIQNLRLIGYDLLQDNAEYLRRGIISFLIAQRPEEQGYKALSSLFNHLIMKQDVPKINYVPIDILTKENLDYYSNY